MNRKKPRQVRSDTKYRETLSVNTTDKKKSINLNKANILGLMLNMKGITSQKKKIRKKHTSK